MPRYPGRQSTDEIIRKEGAGRKKATDKQPGLLEALEKLVDPGSRGDPMPLLRWTCKSTRQLAKAITEQGFKVGRQLVSEMFNELGFSLQGNVKVKDGKQSEDRDEQFQYLNRMIVQFQAEGQPESQLIRRRKSWSERIPTSRKARKSRRLRLRRTFGQSYSLRSLRRHRKCRMGKRRQQLRSR